MSAPRPTAGCDAKLAPPDHLALVWDGRHCTIEFGSALESSSLELKVSPAPAVDLQPVAPRQRAVGAELKACRELARPWPETAGAYDVVLRDRRSRRELATRVWLDPPADARALQKDKSTVVGAYHGTLLLDDGAGLWFAKLRGARGLFSDANYRDMSELTEIDRLRWDPVIGEAAGLQPSAARFGDQLLVSGRELRWSIRSTVEEIAVASWAPDVWEEDVFAFGRGHAVVSVILEGAHTLRRVSLMRAEDCTWTELEDWRVELPLEKDLSAAGFNARGEAAAMIIERRSSGGPTVRLLQDRTGKPTFTAPPYTLPEGFTWPTHTSAAARVDLSGVLRGAFIGRVPGEGFRLFELTSHAGALQAEQITLPVTSAVVGRVDYDGDAPMWVVRTAEGRMGLGHGPNFDEACFVNEIVDGAPFIGGGGVAWQTAPGAPPRVGLCDWVPILRLEPRLGPLSTTRVSLPCDLAAKDSTVRGCSSVASSRP